MASQILVLLYIILFLVLLYMILSPLTVMTEKHIVGVHTEDLRYNYGKWISSWKSHLGQPPTTIRIPAGATAIFTPVQLEENASRPSKQTLSRILYCWIN